MFDAHLFTNRLEGNLTILMQARNLTGYALAMTTGGEGQGAITQINQRLQAVIGGLNQMVEEIRKPGDEEMRRPRGEEMLRPEEEKIRRRDREVDTAMFVKFLTTGERADLNQLNRAHDDMTAVLDLVIEFRKRLIDLAKCRRDAENWGGKS